MRLFIFMLWKSMLTARFRFFDLFVAMVSDRFKETFVQSNIGIVQSHR